MPEILETLRSGTVQLAGLRLLLTCPSMNLPSSDCAEGVRSSVARGSIAVSPYKRRARVPDGDLATIFEKALDLLIDHVTKERFATGRTALPVPTEDANASSSRTERTGSGSCRVSGASSAPARDTVRQGVHALIASKRRFTARRQLE